MLAADAEGDLKDSQRQSDIVVPLFDVLLSISDPITIRHMSLPSKEDILLRLIYIIASRAHGLTGHRRHQQISPPSIAMGYLSFQDVFMEKDLGKGKLLGGSDHVRFLGVK